MPTPETNQTGPEFRGPGSSDWRSLAAGDAGDHGQQAVRKHETELNHLLLTSLQMQHVVVLAGLGCSLEAAGPSMLDLWTQAVGGDPTDAAQATAKKVNHDLADKNIEAFLSRVEAFLHVTDDDDVLQFWRASKGHILALCSQFLEVDNLETHKTFLHRLSRRRVRDQRLKVFTTNYDLCFERAASELGGVALDGFSFSVPRRYDPRFFNYDIIRRPRSGDDSGSYLEGVFLLYKLHGSVNWARAGDTILEKEQPEPDEACLIYPAGGKYQQSFVQPHLESMAQYLAAVREPNTCVLVVGFGFNDYHLAEPLLAAAKTNPHLRLIVVDPMSKENENNGNRYWRQFFALSHRGEDVSFVNATFQDFAQRVPDLKSLTPAENLANAIQGVAREQ